MIHQASFNGGVSKGVCRLPPSRQASLSHSIAVSPQTRYLSSACASFSRVSGAPNSCHALRRRPQRPPPRRPFTPGEAPGTRRRQEEPAWAATLKAELEPKPETAPWAGPRAPLFLIGAHRCQSLPPPSRPHLFRAGSQ